MSESTRCPTCGAELPAPGGECPTCLMKLALGDVVSAEAEREQAAGILEAEMRLGSSIGPYRLQRILGEGGMGLVYLAEQAEPIQRQVALKVIKIGMDSREVLGRFAIERQSLALMEHPNIARVLDAGTTPRGRPFFVMEYVPGVPITDYCDDKRLGTRERVELFIDVCRAIEHAHRRGIIHRDLKPSNVLVTEIDGRPVAKIIDFGVAKATSQRLAERTAFTELGRIIGTPEYMSPEQARGTGLDIDTRTDVYSLGILLYELLVGFLPFETRELRLVGIEAILRAIREHETPRPSRRIHTLGKASAESARRRRTDPQSLARHLRGDLDWIVMRAIEKDPERRYSGASALSDELERYLKNEPVMAGPPGSVYRLRKFVRKHRIGLTAGMIVLVAVGTVAAIYTVRLKRQRDRAEREAAKAGQVVEFLKGLFAGSDPRETAGLDVSVSDLLARGAESIETKLTGQPRVQAELDHVLGAIYTELGDHATARRFLNVAIEHYARLPDERRGLAITLRDLARLDYKESHHDEADEGLRRALELLAAAGEDSSREAAIVHRDIGVNYVMKGEVDPGIAECELALAMLDALPGDPDATVVETIANLGYLYLRKDDLAHAQPILERGLELGRKVLGDRHPDLGYHFDYNAQLQRRLGNLPAAEALAREALKLRTEVLGESHPQTIESVHNVGVLLDVQGKSDEAEPLFRRALEARREIFGNEHRQVAISLYVLAALLERRLDLGEAQPLFEEAAAIQRKTQGDRHYVYARTLARLGALDLKQGKVESAEERLRESLDIMSEALPPKHPERARPLIWLGWVLLLNGRSEEAEAFLREALEIRRVRSPGRPALIAEAELALASCLVRLGRGEEARPLLTSAVPPLQEKLSPGAWLLGQIEATQSLLE